MHKEEAMTEEGQKVVGAHVEPVIGSREPEDEDPGHLGTTRLDDGLPYVPPPSPDDPDDDQP